MKKLRNVLVAFVAVLTLGMMNAKAMTEDELKEVLTKSYTINGAVFKATDAQKVQIEDYLRNNDLSADECDIIAKQVEAAVKIVEDSGENDINKLSASVKNELKAVAEEVSTKTSVKVKITSEGATIYNQDGTVAAEGVGAPDGKYTDSSWMIVGASLVAVIGIAAIVVVSKKANA